MDQYITNYISFVPFASTEREELSYEEKSGLLPLSVFIEEAPSGENVLSSHEFVVEWDPDMLEIEEVEKHEEDSELESQDLLTCDFSSPDEQHSPQHCSEHDEHSSGIPCKKKIGILFKAILVK